MTSPSRTTLATTALLMLGMAQMTGALLDLPALKGLAAMTAASPAPKVFSSAKGLETFSTEYALRWEDPAGTTYALPLTYEIYPRLQGPYNRRNVWGAVLAFGPVLATEPLTIEMFDDISTFGLCGDAPVLQELGLDPDRVHHVRVIYTPREGTSPDLPMILRPECDQ